MRPHAEIGVKGSTVTTHDGVTTESGQMTSGGLPDQVPVQAGEAVELFSVPAAGSIALR